MSRIKYKEAIGIEIKKGKPTYGKKPTKSELEKLYVHNLKSIREVAEILNCSKDMIYRALNEYGIKRRAGSMGRRSKLRKYRKEAIIESVKKKGLTNTAKKLEVDIRTLKKFLDNS